LCNVETLDSCGLMRNKHNKEIFYFRGALLP
jgi:hypothetical protein